MTRTAQRPPDAFATIVTDRWSEPYWTAAREGWLTCAQCRDCGRFRMPPSPFCPHCRSQAIEWPTLPGTGTIYSYTIVERAVLPGTEDCVPYVVAIVSLDGAEPARLITNIVESAVEDVAIDSRVRVLFQTMPDGAVVPRFYIEPDA